MKRLIIYVATMLVTFALGFGIQSLISRYQKENPAPVEAISAAPLTVPAPLFAPAPPIPSASTAAPETILVLDYNRDKFTPWGVFYVMGNKPKEFADMDSIELGLYRDVDNAGRLPVAGWVWHR